jgi:hypothetical protein
VKSSGNCFLGAQRSCVPEIAQVVPHAAAVLDNVKESPWWYCVWRHEGVMKNSWGLALWEAREGHWWRCSFSCSWWPRTEGVMQRSWGLAPWRVPMRGYWWSLVAAEDQSVLEMTVPWDDPKNSSSSGVDQPELRMLQRAELEKWRQPLGGAQKIMCGSQTLEQETVKLKLP